MGTKPYNDLFHFRQSEPPSIPIESAAPVETTIIRIHNLQHEHLKPFHFIPIRYFPIAIVDSLEVGPFHITVTKSTTGLTGLGFLVLWDYVALFSRFLFSKPWSISDTSWLNWDQTPLTYMNRIGIWLPCSLRNIYIIYCFVLQFCAILEHFRVFQVFSWANNDLIYPLPGLKAVS